MLRPILIRSLICRLFDKIVPMGEKGFIIRWLLLSIVVLTLAYYFFNWSIFDAVESEQGQNTVNYIRDVLNAGWSYIKIPFVFVWEKIFQ